MIETYEIAAGALTRHEAALLAEELLEFARGGERSDTVTLIMPIGPAGAQVCEVTARPVKGSVVRAARERFATDVAAQAFLVQSCTGLTQHDLDALDARDLRRVEEAARGFF